MGENKLDEAYDTLNKGLKINPLDVNLLYALANLYEIENKHINAYVLYKKIYNISNEKMLEKVKSKIHVYEKLDEIKEYNKRKKVLIIAYIFPPIGGSGVQRTLKFVKYLRKFGYEPVIVIVLYSEFMSRDDTLLYEVPNDVQVVRIEEMGAYSKYYKDFASLYGGVLRDNYLLNQYEIKLQSSLMDMMK